MLGHLLHHALAHLERALGTASALVQLATALGLTDAALAYLWSFV